MNTHEISICIVNWNRSRLDIGNGKILELLPNCIKSLAEAYRDYDSELIIADFCSTDWPLNQWLASVWTKPYSIIDCQLPFSLGMGRNNALTHVKGKIIYLIDADMIVPTDYAKITIEQIEKGFALFPLYRRQGAIDGNKNYSGAGWGNAVITTDILQQVRNCKHDKIYPESTLWGGEDTAMVNAIRGHKIAPLWREEIAGFIHQYHPKSGSYWYSQINKGNHEKSK